MAGVGIELFGIRTTPFVGRTATRDTLWHTLHDVHRSQRPQGVVIEGPHECGKTRLAQWFTWRAAEVGAATVVKVTSDDLPGTQQGISGMLLDFFRATELEPDKLANRIESRVRQLNGNAESAPIDAEALASVVESHRNARRSVRTGRRLSRRHEAATKWVMETARARPVILWLEDVDEDSESVQFALNLIDAVEAPPVLILMTQRSGAEVGTGLERFRAHASVDVIGLEPLPTEEHSELVQNLLGLSPALSNIVVRHTRGHPRFAHQLIANWIDEGRLTNGPDGYDLDGAIDLPPTLTDLYAERLQRLIAGYHGQGDIWLTVEIAAAFGRAVDDTEWHDACASVDLPADPYLVDALVKAGLARGGHAHWAFSNDLVRSVAIRWSHARGRWAKVNRACLHAVRKNSRNPLRRARHLIEAGERLSALGALRLGVRDLVTEGHFPRALATIDQHDQLAEDTCGPESPECRALTPTRIDVLRLLDRLPEARETLAALRAWANGRPGVSLDILSGLARCEGQLAAQDDTQAGLSHYNRALGLASEMTDPHDLIEAMLCRGRALHALGQTLEATVTYERAAANARERNSAEQLAWAIQGLAETKMSAQRDGAIELAVDAERMFQEVGSPLGQARAMLCRGEALRGARRYADATEAFACARDLLDVLQSTEVFIAEYHQAFLDFDVGRQEHGGAAFKRLLEVGMDCMPHPHRPAIYLGSALDACERNDLDGWMAAIALYEPMLDGAYHRHPAHLQMPVRMAETWNMRTIEPAARHAWCIAAKTWARIDRRRASMYGMLGTANS